MASSKLAFRFLGTLISFHLVLDFVRNSLTATAQAHEIVRCAPPERASATQSIRILLGRLMRPLRRGLRQVPAFTGSYRSSSPLCRRFLH